MSKPMLPRSDGWIQCEPDEYKALTTGWWTDQRIHDALGTTS